MKKGTKNAQIVFLPQWWSDDQKRWLAMTPVEAGSYFRDATVQMAQCHAWYGLVGAVRDQSLASEMVERYMADGQPGRARYLMVKITCLKQHDRRAKP
jgi:hypothetical protein